MTKTKQEILGQPKVLEDVLAAYGSAVPDAARALKGKDIFLIGTGASLHACLQAKYAFLRYSGQNVSVIPACEIPYYSEALKEGSFVILVSQSGESYETKEVCGLLLERHIPFYGITNQPESTLARSATETFLCYAGEEVSSATKTHTATLLLLYMLAAGHDSAAMGQISRIPELAGDTIALTERVLERLCGFSGQDTVVYLAGKGAHAPTMQQAALLLKEKVFLNAEGMALAEFRHGPVEALRPGTKVLIAASGGLNVEDACSHARFLSDVCKADVAMLTDLDAPAGQAFPHFGFVWGLDEELSHISATIPFQLMAEHMAETRGYDVDGFKFIGKVLSQY